VLPTCFSLDKSHTKCPRSREGIFALSLVNNLQFRNSLPQAAFFFD
jgi:hypothetical protein